MPLARHIALSARQILGLALATVVAAVVFMAVSPASSLAAAPVTLSGAYVGAGNPSGLSQFGTWSGAKQTVALDYLENNDWSEFTNASWLLDSWKPFVASGGKLVLSVPMLVDSPTGSFAAGAAGAYDKYFLALGQQLVAAGDANITLRMGWEFNGSWFPWSLSSSNPAMSATAFIAYWRHVVTLLRSIPGSHFTFDWTVNSGPSSVPAADAYPGNAYVDYVGIDLYDTSWGSNGDTISDPTARWNQQANQEYGLNWWNAFAKSHGKPLSIPEWGIRNNTGNGVNGDGDDPSFIQDMYSWMKANQPAYEMYFDDLDSTLGASDDPNASAEYQQLWGSNSPSTGSAAASQTGSTTAQPAANTASLEKPAKTAGAKRAPQLRSAHKLSRADVRTARAHKAAKAEARKRTAAKAKARRRAAAQHRHAVSHAH